MEMKVMGRVYNNYNAYGIDVIDEYVMTHTKQVVGGAMLVNEFRVWKKDKVYDRLIAIFYNEEEAKAYLKSKEGERIK